MSENENRNEWIYFSYKEKVHRYISSRICNASDVEDLTASVFLKVYQKYDSFDEQKASLSTWIYTITQHTVYDYYRTGKQNSELPEILCSEDNIEAALIQEENLEELADALERLEQKERDLILFHYYKEMTLKDIAQMMGVSYATAKNIHQRALGSLRKLLKNI